jgi:hypothetical protein
MHWVSFGVGFPALGCHNTIRVRGSDHGVMGQVYVKQFATMSDSGQKFTRFFDFVEDWHDALLYVCLS